MQSPIEKFSTRPVKKDVLRLARPELNFEERIAALKAAQPRSPVETVKGETEVGFPDNVIRQQILRLRVHYLSNPDLKKLPPDTRRTEIKKNLYRFWDEAVASMPQRPGLKEWVRQRIDNELQM